MQPVFTIYHDQLQLSSAVQSTVDHSMAVTDHEEMELHPSVTAEFIPETFPVQNEVFDDINNTGIFVLDFTYFVDSLFGIEIQIRVHLKCSK